MQVDLIPNKKLGPFFIGMPIREALGFIKENELDIPRVKISFDDQVSFFAFNFQKKGVFTSKPQKEAF